MIKNTAPRRKLSNVISINRSAEDTTGSPRMIVSDPESHRVIISIGNQRIVYDLNTRFSKLGPIVEVQPAPVVPTKGSAGKKRPTGKRTWGRARRPPM